MTRLLLADSTIDMRASLATGRFFEQITERPLSDFTAALEYSHSGGAGTFETALSTKPGGYFTLHAHVVRDLPDLGDADEVTLRLRLGRDGFPDQVATRVVAGEHLARVEVPLTVGGQPVRGVGLAAAPFHFSVGVPPRPVRLEGLVLRDHDLESPAAGITVTVAPAAAVVTGADGRFTIPELPVAESLSLTLDDAGSETTVTLRPDYDRHSMSVTFSVPTA